MMRHRFPLAAILALLMIAPARADAPEESCRARAERLSGHRPGGLTAEVGNVTVRLGGSVALGVSRSSGPAAPAAPPFAGAAARERLEAERNEKRAALYRQYFDQCMSAAQD